MSSPEDSLEYLDKDLEKSLSADMLLALSYPEVANSKYDSHDEAYTVAEELALEINQRYASEQRFGERCTLAGSKLIRPLLSTDESTGLPIIIPEAVVGVPGQDPSFVGYFDHLLPTVARPSYEEFKPELMYQVIAPSNITMDSPLLSGRPKVLASASVGRVEFLSDVQTEHAARSLDGLRDISENNWHIIDDISDLLYRDDNHSPDVLRQINKLFLDASKVLDGSQRNSLREFIQSQLAWYPNEEFVVEGLYEVGKPDRNAASLTDRMMAKVALRGLKDAGPDKGLYIFGVSDYDNESQSYIRLSLADIESMQRVLKLRDE